MRANTKNRFLQWGITLTRAAQRDPSARFNILRKVARWLLPHYRLHWYQLEWWDNQCFNEYLDRFNELEDLNTHRRWTLSQLMRLTTAIPGDTAECGVFRGAGSFLICKVSEGHKLYNRTHFMFDSFEGVSNPAVTDGHHWVKGDLSCTLDEVRKNLAEFKNISFHKGWIPEQFADVEDRRFAFVHIDVDLYQPTFDSMEFFYPRMTDGGIILCDDYGFTCCPGATKAVDEFLLDKPEQMLSLPCGGGFLIKGCVTPKTFDAFG